jgi:hypothetical protein
MNSLRQSLSPTRSRNSWHGDGSFRLASPDRSPKKYLVQGAPEPEAEPDVEPEAEP